MMKMKNRFSSIIPTILMWTLLCTQVAPSFAKQNAGSPNDPKQPPRERKYQKAGCRPATAQRDLDLNNVRTTILNGGDMWWNLSNARYEIPKVQTGQVAKHSMFAGALWIGGVTAGNLRIAAQTYRQSGNDYFPGPLTNGAASITEERCKEFDYISKVTLQEIDAFRIDETRWADPSEEFVKWPMGNPANGEEQNLAPYYDNNGNNIYEPSEGDYPSFEQNNPRNIPDMMLFVLYNDKGNIHTESEGLPIGLELQTTCFAYATNDEINNMTFYRTVVINRGNETIDSCVFGQWVDPDLGNYADDYVECDVPRNLGICYNGDDNDEGTFGYGLNPPSVGVTFFEGPRRPDGTEIGLTKFVYYNNDFGLQGNPTRPEHFWGYLNGRWKDGAPITYGGQGRGGADTASFMFPGVTDPAGRANWTERIAGNPPADRRFLQTAGSFSLLPGARNNVTIAVIWARSSTGGATGSFNLLKQASDKAFTLYKNNFNIITGPDAPVLQVVEVDSRLILNLTNTDVVENFVDTFAGPCTDRTVFKFQGYQIFQLKTPNIPSDIYNQDEARLVAQYDIVDGVARLVNSIYDPELEEDVKKIMVEGQDKGIRHSLEISKDLFETGSDQTLVNFKNYHFVIFAYAYASNCVNDVTQYLPSRKTIGRRDLSVYTATPHPREGYKNGAQINASYGDGFIINQLEGIGNGAQELDLTAQSVTELMSPANNYFSPVRSYVAGKGPINVKVIDPVKLPDTEFHLYMRDTSANAKKDSSLSRAATYWFLKNVSTGEVVRGSKVIGSDNEQIFANWGLSVQINQALIPGSGDADPTNGYITSSIQFANPANEWLDGVRDEDASFSNIPYAPQLTLAPQFNWIRSGSAGSTRSPAFSNGELDDYGFSTGALDSRRAYSNIISSKWAPYALASSWRTNEPTKFPTFGAAWDLSAGVNGPGQNNSLGAGTARIDNALSDLQGIDIVYTSDRSKWTRCIVVEMGENASLNQGLVDKHDVRRAASVDKFGRKVGDPGAINDPSNPEAANYVADSGMSWFPGYAYNIETGERLNIIFGEDSSLPLENGSDMVWNPTARFLDFNSARPLFGGKHYVYVLGSNKKFNLGSGPSGFSLMPTRYDECKYVRCIMDMNCDPRGNGIQSAISPNYLVRKRMLYAQVMWTSMPYLSNESKLLSIEEGLIPSEAKIRIRVKRPYAIHSHTATTINDSMPYYTFKTTGVAPTISKEAGVKLLDNVAVIPNPYYANSAYEDPGNSLASTVRIVNLPSRCTIRIYTVDGSLVRTIKKDDPNAPYIDWNIKNDVNVPIASGMYLIHVVASDLGEERIIKWFGIMRTADYDTF